MPLLYIRQSLRSLLDVTGAKVGWRWRWALCGLSEGPNSNSYQGPLWMYRWLCVTGQDSAGLVTSGQQKKTALTSLFLFCIFAPLFHRHTLRVTGSGGHISAYDIQCFLMVHFIITWKKDFLSSQLTTSSETFPWSPNFRSESWTYLDHCGFTIQYGCLVYCIYTIYESLGLFRVSKKPQKVPFFNWNWLIIQQHLAFRCRIVTSEVNDTRP